MLNIRFHLPFVRFRLDERIEKKRTEMLSVSRELSRAVINLK